MKAVNAVDNLRLLSVSTDANGLTADTSPYGRRTERVFTHTCVCIGYPSQIDDALNCYVHGGCSQCLGYLLGLPDGRLNQVLRHNAGGST
ncbi:unnamed protein product [Strongylus vulgaris]|uniref:Uncharacterized protein n=1 Tax=Strongylus vulgaris TaxID=40348 RepID=A0A3P7JH84_STRVU|nr:unnamed protein product [Strongylus vulgaris]